MDPARYRRLKELFAEASALPEEKRRAYLDEVCGEDVELRREVEELLASEASSRSGALGRALDETPVQEPPSSQVGLPERIAGFRVVRVCGYGGMGIVYEAEQDTPRRRVALKVVQAGARPREMLSRFRREVEILGRLQHPAIAQVFAAGEFRQDGHRRPFFAMEYIEGLPLTEHARRNGLGIEERVELFARVCDAVEYAHGEGVVHRDLKPDNVLVIETASGPRPKVLDFGVARLTGTDLAATLATGAGELLGSVPYMSPEQAAGQPGLVDERSDVHALGALLFELLADRLPYELEDRPLADALDTIRHAEPARLGAVRPELRGDLETIVGKCLEKEPARRYPSVAALAEELRRFLSDDPIAARPPSTWYQLRRYARRHRALVGGAAATLLALVAGLVVSVALAIESKRNEELAEHARDSSAREATRANLAAASALLERDPLAARASLMAVDPARRGWEWRYLDGQLAGYLLDFGAERAGVDAGPLVCFDQGRRVAALRDEATLGIWEVETGRELELVAAPEPTTAWAVSADARRVAVGTAAGRVLVRGADEVWRTWREGGEPVAELAFDPTGERLAILAGEELIVGAPGAWSHAGTGRADSRARLGFSTDGRSLLTISADEGTRICLWDARTLEERAARGSPGGARCFAFSPDGTRIALGEAFREIELVDAADLRPLDRLLGHQRAVEHVEFGADGRLLSTSADGTIRLWDLERREAVVVLAEPDVRGAAFATPGRFVSATADRLRLWALERPRSRVLDGHRSYVYELAFSGDGALLASYVYHGAELSVWDPASGELLARGTALRAGHELGFDPAGTSVWIRSAGHVQHKPWSRMEAKATTETRTPTLAHCFDYDSARLDLMLAGSEPIERSPRLAIHRTVHGAGPDGNELAAWREGRRLELDPSDPPRAGGVNVGEHPRLFVGARSDSPFHEFQGRLAELLFYAGALSEADASAVERFLDARRAGEAAELPTVKSARLLAHFRADARTVEHDPESSGVTGWRATNDPALRLVRHGAPAETIRFSEPDEDYACATLEFWSWNAMRSWLEAAFPAARDALPVSVLWLGEYIDGGGTACCYSVASCDRTGEPFRDPRVPAVGTATSFSGDGLRIATCGLRRGMAAIVRDARTGAVLRVFDGSYMGVALSPDGRRLVCGDTDGRVDLWSVESGELLAMSEDHAGEVYALAWSPDGARIASGGNDNSVVLREADTLERLLTLRGHRQYVKSLAFSPDGTLLASASGDRTVRVWDSLPIAERHARLLAERAVELELRARVEAWLAEASDPAEVERHIREALGADPRRRRAALKLLARSR